MNKHSFACFFLIAFSFALQAQSSAPLYLMYTKDCMSQLDYRYTYSGTEVPAYSVQLTNSEQFLLMSAPKGIESPSLQKGVQTCRTFDMNGAFADAINNKTRQVYIVHQIARGYLLMPITSAIHVSRSGPIYIVEAPNYSFILDTTKLVNETNLAATNSASNVYFTGVKFKDCRYQYSFRREAARQGIDRADFDFIPGIGIITDRAGMNSAEALGNQMDLMRVNGLLFDDYIKAACAGVKETPVTVSPYTPPVGYDTNYRNTPYNESNKEEEAMRQNLPPRPNEYNHNPNMGPTDPFAYCAVKPGQGYHVVLPKENLRAIAKHYDLDMKNLMSWNNIKNADKINICQVIWLRKPPADAQKKLTKNENVKPVQHSTPNEKVKDQSGYWQGSDGRMVYEPSRPDAVARPEDYTRPNEYSRITQVEPDRPVQYQYTQPDLRSKEDMQPIQYQSGSQKSTPVAVDNYSDNLLYSSPQAIHIVSPPDNLDLGRISKLYGCSEECVRVMNKFPKKGEVKLQLDDRLLIPECPCEVVSRPREKGSDGSPRIQDQGSRSDSPTQYNTTPRPSSYESGTPSQPIRDTYLDKPVPYGYENKNPKPEYQDSNQKFNSLNNNNNTPREVPKQESVQPLKPQPPAEEIKYDYPKEYIVKQGDTLRSIAIKNKTSESELILINEGLEANKPLITGQRILVPYRL